MGGLEQNDGTGEIFLITITEFERGIIKAIIKNQIEQCRGQVDGVLSELTKEDFGEMYSSYKIKKNYTGVLPQNTKISDKNDMRITLTQPNTVSFLPFKEKYYQYYQQEINKILQYYDGNCIID